jgi:Rieske Fe-S protein
MTDVERLGPEDPSRRRMLQRAAGCLGACAALGPLSAACAAIFGPVRGGATEIEGGGADVGRLDDLEPGVAKKFTASGRVRDGWFRFAEAPLGSILVVRDGAKVRAFSTVCPHARCDVEPAKDGRSLVCPCHKSMFALDGSVVSGPSPRGLDELETSLDQGRVRVRFAKRAL